MIESTITESMKSNGCVVIEGPKWFGKSTTAERFAKSVVKLQKPATYNQYKSLADIGDDNLLLGEKPLLFDEWQKIPELWDYIRYYIDETESWMPKLRSKTIIRTTSTKHFVDPSIATAILDANPNNLMNDLNTFGLLFENLVIRDLKIYVQSLEGNVYNYRDKSGLEADAVIHLNDGRWGLIEIKHGGERLINQGARTLQLLKDKIDQEKMNKPAFLAIITAADSFAYKREDGVYVVPIGCLKP